MLPKACHPGVLVQVFSGVLVPQCLTQAVADGKEQEDEKEERKEDSGDDLSGGPAQ